jgi:hypothetical protein
MPQMALEQQRLSQEERANLVAYLDHELNEAESRAIASKLTESVSARRELEALEKTWEMLEYLPRPQPSTELTARTVSQVHLLTLRDDKLFSFAGKTARRALQVIVLALSSILTLVVGYAATRWLLPDPSARLIRDLSLAEHLDEYLAVGSFAFLQRLDDDPEFSRELSSIPSERGRPTPPVNEQRLRMMPREQRLRLEKNLARFDLLGAAEQSAVRELDEQLAASLSTNRTRYRSLLRRYSLWLQGLKTDYRNKLKQPNEDQRLTLVKQFRKEVPEKKNQRNDYPRVQLAQMNTFSILETARLLKVWLPLEPAEKTEIEKLRLPPDRLKRLRDLGRERGIAMDDGPTKEEWVEIQKYLDRAPDHKRDFEAAKSKKQARKVAEARYFFDKKFEPVDSVSLFRFNAALPGWIRDQFDPFPPEGVRRRLTILYRLVYPAPEEMPDPRKDTATATAREEQSAPPPSGGGQSPF